MAVAEADLRRVCSRCREPKWLGAFRARSRGGLDSYCWECRKAVNREGYARNRVKRAASNAARYKANRERYRYRAYQSRWSKENRERVSTGHWRRGLKSRYGLTVADYERILAEQGGFCAICRRDKLGRFKRFHVDHDHATGRVRGLLCPDCNLGLGKFADDPSRLQAALKYLAPLFVLHILINGAALRFL
jgi:hypothetical protein